MHKHTHNCYIDVMFAQHSHIIKPKSITGIRCVCVQCARCCCSVFPCTHSCRVSRCRWSRSKRPSCSPPVFHVSFLMEKLNRPIFDFMFVLFVVVLGARLEPPRLNRAAKRRPHVNENVRGEWCEYHMAVCLFTLVVPFFLNSGWGIFLTAFARACGLPTQTL